MPEGHKIHRVAKAFAADFAQVPIEASSPQGRFSAGAEQITGKMLTDSRAVGKQMFLTFGDATVLRVHLGIYGMWDFAGAMAGPVEVDARIGRTGIKPLVGADQDPPEPIGQVRLRLLTPGPAWRMADLRGPNTCEILDPQSAATVMAKLGPDPLSYRGTRAQAAAEFARRIANRSVPIAALLMDQSVVAGIGNVYRAEMLFRARLNPFVTGRELSAEAVAALWVDWVGLLKIGVRTGKMLTMEGISAKAKAAAVADRVDRHWVYGRAGLPCRVCGTDVSMQLLAGRKLYWCRVCQA
ncbi:Fpg/Nei family DNA glycosylase [Nakamurella antarctica]|uniref:DNA-(apurinic or apyrimidinic site) lyase n=1 Tax=Nakamurella antarctica TaxID=1902245 RepID=A0A3G8ZYI6_9ACTN|nr:DNA-formamidopyrimidine glycosylase family protein [Nakamurella antarctica]AZI58641.1 Fpg/Nei family DNA glycosylase [Nakamurella antarctica]